MTDNKILLRKGDQVDVGDFFLEINRFDKQDYRVYEVISEYPRKVDQGHHRWGTFKVIAKGPKTKIHIGYECEGYMDYFENKNSAWLCYRLPVLDLLYKK